MAVQPQTPYIEHIANGTATGFNLGFDCDDQDHLIVLVDDAEPAVGSWSLVGGAVVFGAAPTSGNKITIQRNTPFERKRDYQSYDNSFRPPVVNKDFDRIWLKTQELGVSDWLLGLKIQKFRDDVNLTALEETLEQAKEIRDATADSVIEVQSNVEQSQTLLVDTTSKANQAEDSATAASAANTAAQQALVQANAAEGNVYAALSAQTATVNTALVGFTNGASKWYATLALAEADIANITIKDKVDIGEIANGGTWYKATAGATSLTKSAYDPVLSAKSYTDKLFSTKLTTTTNLNDLPTGAYYISKLDLDVVYNAGNFTSLGYPSALIKGSGAIVTVTRSEGNGTYSYQSLELVRLGLRFTRYGAVGGSFDEWVLPKPIAPFTSLSISDNLNNIVTQGVYFVDGTTANNASKGVRSYPQGLAIAPAIIVVGKDKDNNVVQTLTQGGMTFTRSFTPVTNVVVSDWSSLTYNGVKAFESVTNGFKAVGIGENFWVYPASVNTLTAPALYKKASSTESSVLYEAQQSSPLDGLIVTEGQPWSAV